MCARKPNHIISQSKKLFQQKSFRMPHKIPYTIIIDIVKDAA